MNEFRCEEALSAMHDRLDAPLAQPLATQLDEHLAACATCRQHEAELRLVQGELRELPLLTLPEHDLEKIWDRTVRAPRPLIVKPAAPRRWIPALAAAAVFAALIAPFAVEQFQRQHGPSAAELEQMKALRELRTAFRLTGHAMARSASETGELLDHEVVPAMQRLPAVGTLVGGKSPRR